MNYDNDNDERPERALMGVLCLVSAAVVCLVLYWVL